MNLKLNKIPETEPAQSVSLGTPDDAGPQTRTDSGNVVVSYGIHRGRYPIVGMRVREARQVLQKLINIDPSAVPVIAGFPVDEEQVISEDISMLSFVKPSAMKGSPTERIRRGAAVSAPTS